MAILTITINAESRMHKSDRVIDEDFYELAFRPADFYTNEQAPKELLCDDDAVVMRTLKARDSLIKILSKSIAAELAKMMDERDTRNGYTRKELRK